MKPGGLVAVREADFEGMIGIQSSRAWPTGGGFIVRLPGPVVVNQMLDDVCMHGHDKQVLNRRILSLRLVLHATILQRNEPGGAVYGPSA